MRIEEEEERKKEIKKGTLKGDPLEELPLPVLPYVWIRLNLHMP